MGTKAESPAAALFGKTRRAVLGLLFMRPDEALHLREIVRLTQMGHGAVQRELAGLVRAGLITRTRRGAQVHFQVNEACPVTPEVRSLILKSSGLAEVLRGALAPLADRIRTAFVYGSVARGEHRLDSDVDLCVVGAVSFREVVDAISSAQDVLGREVNPTVYSGEEFRDKLASRRGFVSRIMHEPKMLLLGDEHELGRLAQERVAGVPSARSSRDRRPAGDRRPRSRRRAHPRAQR